MTDRRTFLKSAVFTSLATTATQTYAQSPSNDQWVSVIDLDRCDGCASHSIPACVKACQEKNQTKFPEPQKPLKPYWPQKKFEDFSDERNRIDRLTPYNWLYVETIQVGNRTIYAPRRCMHCFDAPCRKICPFGAIDKSEQGAVGINPNVCFGGAKCRDVCPWEVPQRQAGVGLYLDIAPKFAGGGVMYKCDFCADRLQKGETPACAQACPKGAMIFAPLKVIEKEIQKMANGRYIYGQKENGGTATWYISSVPFETLQKSLAQSGVEKKNNGRAGFQETEPKLQTSSGWAKATLAAPLAAVGVAYLLRQRKKLTSKANSSDKEE